MNFFITLKILGVVHHLYVFSPFSPSILKPNLKIQGKNENKLYLFNLSNNLQLYFPINKSKFKRIFAKYLFK